MTEKGAELDINPSIPLLPNLAYLGDDNRWSFAILYCSVQINRVMEAPENS